jgi:hypothetical protein
MVYNSASDTVVWSLRLPPSQAPPIHPSTSNFNGLGPIHIPDQAPFNLRFNPFWHSLVRELDCEWLVVCISQYYLIRPLVGWVKNMLRDFLA